MAQLNGMSSPQANNTEMATDHIEKLSLSGSSGSPLKTIEYWTKLIRKNLSKAHAVPDIESCDDDASSIHVPNIDEEIMNAPRRRSARDDLAHEVANLLYPAPSKSLAPIIRYEKDVTMLRSLVMEQRRKAALVASERNARLNWIMRISKQGPWDEVKDPLSLKGASALPMPVGQSDEESLAPFFAHLANDGTHEPSCIVSNDASGYKGTEPYYNTELIEFEKGVLYADGRVDLCKMVTGPQNIGNLMESLKSNEFSKHFLLGNNIIGPTGAKAIASFLDEYPDRFETWYLAGNCLNMVSFMILVDSMIDSSAITNVWLKRNPLGVGAAKDVFRLITQTRNLRTLDLDQTELGDTGVQELFELLTGFQPAEPLALRNIYLNACGIGEKACRQIAQYLQSPHCTLESLYMSTNPIGHAVSTLADGLKANKTLKRLALQSCGLKDDDIIALAAALTGHPTIKAVDIGQGYATEDLGGRFNWMTDKSTKAIATLIGSTKIHFLDLSYTPASQDSLCNILKAVSASNSLLWFHVKPLVTGNRDVESVKAGQEYSQLKKLTRERLHQNVREQYGMDYVQFEHEHKRFLMSPVDVRFIDSVYRNRDAAAARRGLKKLNKWWNEHDETLKRVQDGMLA